MLTGARKVIKFGRFKRIDARAERGCGDFRARDRVLPVQYCTVLYRYSTGTVPVKRHRGEPGHTHGTHGRTQAHGSPSDKPQTRVEPGHTRDTRDTTVLYRY